MALQTAPEEVSSLKPYQNFRLTLHGLHGNVPEMFAACAMQDLYIHEREDFRHIDQARRRLAKQWSLRNTALQRAS